MKLKFVSLNFSPFLLLVTLSVIFQSNIVLTKSKPQELMSGTSIKDIRTQCDANGINYKEAVVFVNKLQKAIKKNDKEVVADLIDYPLSIYVGVGHNGTHYKIKDRKIFLAKYDAIFDASTKRAILNQNPYDILCGYEGGMIAGGIWFTDVPIKIYQIDL